MNASDAGLEPMWNPAKVTKCC